MLRLATLADLDEVASWIPTARDCELWTGWRVTFPIDRTSLPRAINFEEGKAFSLTEGEALVGFGQLIRKDGGRVHLARLIVRPGLRGRGHGEKLVRALLERARPETLARVSLNVDSSNLTAVSLYLKIGFMEAQRPPDEPVSAGSRYMEMTHW